ncbi:HigA family addiction module antidote protein, partial [bacterium]|nr:HigA family addiction module antidote protein [bacterium]
MDNRTLSYAPDMVSAPGRTLKRIIEAVGMTQSELAARLGKTEKFVSELMNGKATITAETAIHLERVLGTPAGFWCRREADYRTWQAREQQAQELRDQDEWARSFPLKRMAEYAWIPRSTAPGSRVEALLQFFGVATPSEWDAIWSRKLETVRFRMSGGPAADKYATAAWLRYGELCAQRSDMPDFDRKLFTQVLAQARTFTTYQPEDFQPRLVELCAKAGVALVFTPDLPGTRVFAATRWQTARRPLIQIGPRYKTEDQLWFSFFHEAFHVLLHRKNELFVAGNSWHSAEEDEADRAAADFLIPPDQYSEMLGALPISKAKIKAWAMDLGIAPGIVVGRLQHDGHLPPSQGNEFKRRYEWKAH